ncbi:MAG: Mrp/NBP35 family ATP-binding protein [Leptospiraceae bacterium]|nr:Mrp/NBP35 family ATP-binding protein [Leptospiraceae bacterium]
MGADEIKKLLVKIKHPDLNKDIISLGMVNDVTVSDNETLVKLRTPTADRKLQINLEAQVRQAVSKQIEGKLKIKFDVDPNLSLDDSNKVPGIKRIIAVGSGKGGVGKSTVTLNLALSLASKGYKVGVMDADIYGPSIGKMIGVNGRVALKVDEDIIHPLEKYGIKIITFAFLVDENQPVVWRGPMLGKAVEQFLFQVSWGELDFLLVDLPPGTGDVQLSLCQLIDLTGAVIVTTPQKVATLDASKAAAMFAQVKVPVLGVVENMSYFIPPDMLDKKYNIFGEGGGQDLASDLKTQLLGKIPHVIDIMQGGESGNPQLLKEPGGVVEKTYKEIADKLEEEIKKWED